MTEIGVHVTCPFCGARYGVVEGRLCRAGCPLRGGCDLLRCPQCAYEMPAPTRLTRALERWLGRPSRRRRLAGAP